MAENTHLLNHHGKFVARLSETLTKNITLSQVGVKKLVFLYDNGKTFTASGIKVVNFNTHDVNYDSCIEYSNHRGVHRVYRYDLAAITVTYYDSVIMKRLLPKVALEHKARMHKVSVKTPKPATSVESLVVTSQITVKVNPP